MDTKISGYLTSLLAVLTTAAIGCGGDLVEGSWESDQKFGGYRHEFSVEADGDGIVGEGSFYLAAIDGSFVRCLGEIEAEVKREGKYAVTVCFSGAHGCSEVPDVDLDCELQR